jgi:hypothetical protein
LESGGGGGDDDDDDDDMHLKEIGCESVVWIQLDQGRVQWQALVITVMDLLFNKKWG